MLKGESRTPEFLAMNPNGKVPVLAIDGVDVPAGVQRDPLVPRRGHARSCRMIAWTRARVLQWMFFEQYSHEPAIAVARFIRCFLKRTTIPRLPELTKRGDAALGRDGAAPGGARLLRREAR